MEAAVPMLPELTSATQLSTYAACPRKYRYRYLDHVEPEYKAVGLVLGSAVHSSIGWYFERRKEGITPSIMEVLPIVGADLEAALEPNVRMGRWNKPDLTRHAFALVECFLEKYGELPVTGSEVPFEIELFDPETGEVLPRKMLGYLDFTVEGAGLIELKTARAEYSAVNIARNLQFGGYSYALNRLRLGKYLDIIVIIKNRQPRIQQIRLQPSDKTEFWFLQSATAIERAILSGNYPPAPGFSCAICEYQEKCLGISGVQHAKAA
jgi:CRISPR/Cas system-associated exonuclease Cas4 (RecB family)